MGLTPSKETNKKVGYQVTDVQKDSPAQMAGLVPIFDFIISTAGSANDIISFATSSLSSSSSSSADAPYPDPSKDPSIGEEFETSSSSVAYYYFDHDGPEFVEMMRLSAGKEVVLQVWNSMTEAIRDVTVVPQLVGDSGYAGVSVRFTSYENPKSLVWHVLEVFEDSPAEKAGFESQNDYIVGSPAVLFKTSNDLFLFFKQSIDKSIPLYVFNSNTCSLRIAYIAPSTWAGDGIIGCDIGFGIIHQVPVCKVESYNLEKV